MNDNLIELNDRRRKESIAANSTFLDLGMGVCDVSERSRKTKKKRALSKHAIRQYVALEGSQLVRTMRLSAGLTQKGLAKALGVNQSRVAYMEGANSKKGPTLEAMHIIAYVCRCRIRIVLDCNKTASLKPIRSSEPNVSIR